MSFPAFLLPAFCALLIVLPSRALPGTLYLSVCASMAESFKEVQQQFVATHPETDILLNIGPSGSLARQIEQGAPSDLFVSANQEWMSYLLDRKLVVGSTMMTLASNRLVFVGPPDGTISGPEALATLERIAIGNPASVPAGQYAREAMIKLGLYDDLRSNGKLVLAKDVRQALFYAERGEVDGAFVYLSDTTHSSRTITHFEVDPSLHTPITYPFALTAAGYEKKEARLLHDFLASPGTAAVIHRHGFAPVR